MKKAKAIYQKNKKFIEYSAVSITCTILLYLIYILITYFSKGHYILANTVAYIVSFTILYLWDLKIFNCKYLSKKKRFKQLLLFIFFRILGYIIDSFILVLFIEKFYLPIVTAKIISSMITFMFNYYTNKIFIFNING